MKTDKARFLWSDTEELQVIANLYQVKIKVIKTEGDNYLNPVVLWIYPAEEIKTSRLIPEGCVSDMVLINYSDRHYNLVISKDHDILGMEFYLKGRFLSIKLNTQMSTKTAKKL